MIAILVAMFVPVAMTYGPIAALLVWRHRGNIRKLFDGTESRLGQKTAGAALHAAKQTFPKAAR